MVRLVQSDGTVKDAAIRLLEVEERAVKWYSDAGRAYSRFRARELASKSLSAEVLASEMENWQTVMYSMPSKPGAPPDVFVKALEEEHRVHGGLLGNVQRLSGDREVVVLDE